MKKFYDNFIQSKNYYYNASEKIYSWQEKPLSPIRQSLFSMINYLLILIKIFFVVVIIRSKQDWVIIFKHIQDVCLSYWNTLRVRLRLGSYLFRITFRKGYLSSARIVMRMAMIHLN